MSRPSEPAVVVSSTGNLPEAGVQRLQDVFTRHLEAHGGGMGFTLYRAGEPLVELYGGPADTAVSETWNAETLAVLFSGTKGVVTTAMACLDEEGLLDVEAPVAEYWPEFAQAGKQDVRVHQLLGHSVGLLYVDPAPEGSELKEPREMAARLAAQEPLWEPGTKVAYHAVTFGHLVEELAHRVAGTSVGELVRTRLREPHGLDVFLGLPASEEPRVTDIHREEGYRVATFLRDDPERRAIVDRMYGSHVTGETLTANSPAFRAVGHAAGGAVGSAAAMARMYSLLASGDSIVSQQTLRRFTRTEAEGLDAVNDRPVRFGIGYELDDPIGTYGPVRPAFGHTGAGGGVHGAWPELGVGFSFLPNLMCSEDTDTRAKDLLAEAARALHEG